MASLSRISGTGVALVTPFTQDNTVDHAALDKLVRFVADGGVNFLVALGTTAETVTLSEAERAAVIQTIQAANVKRLPIIMGMGSNNTAQLLETLATTDFSGIDGILSVTPFYNKPTQEGLYQHYKALAEAAPRPIILYNVPSRTGANLEATTCLRLANDFDNIIAVKEASGDQEQIMDIIKDKPNDFALLSGEDAGTLPLMALGGDGVISVVANAFPKAFSNMVEAAMNNDYGKARQLHYGLTDITKSIFREGNPAGIKALLQIMGMMENQLRLPLTPASDATYNKLKAQLEAFRSAFWNAF
ncbi:MULTISPECIES: 4-hydroxy-tetrahydrodipicolinate synthase [unclassified Carboxylicivirga]|uniref:4-hydroxy-tetrahydrodipicolinate synthase n=1 Tax=Carboxylicivirga TaxID=1628153 RepID=UPI003D32B765